MAVFFLLSGAASTCCMGSIQLGQLEFGNAMGEEKRRKEHCMVMLCLAITMAKTNKNKSFELILQEKINLIKDSDTTKPKKI